MGIKRTVEHTIKSITADQSYYVLKKTWNRNILFGPHTRLLAREFAEEHAKGGEALGGPVLFVQLAANLGRYRVVKGKKGTVVVEDIKRVVKK